MIQGAGKKEQVLFYQPNSALAKNQNCQITENLIKFNQRLMKRDFEKSAKKTSPTFRNTDQAIL